MAALAGDGNGTGSEGAVGPRAKYGVDRPAIYNAEGMHDKLEDISCLDQVDWIEHQALTGAAKTEVEDVNDDVERELAFYNQALEAAKECIGRLEEAKVPWNRPRDYYAEMVKSDEHMARVKQQLMLEQKSIAGKTAA